MELMLKKGIRSYTKLSTLLRSHGYNFNQSSFSSWAFGRNSAPKTLPPALAEVLRLNEEERAKLARTLSPTIKT